MKIPFHTILGPILKSNQKSIKSFCTHPALTFSPIYVGILGSVGVVLSVFDIIRIINCGPILPGYLWRCNSKGNKCIAPETERDFKLIGLAWSFEYYLFLLIGLITGNPIFFLPFLIIHAIIVFLEFCIFCVRVFSNGIVFSKSSLIMAMFMIYNWLAVFCTSAHCASKCDLD